LSPCACIIVIEPILDAFLIASISPSKSVTIRSGTTPFSSNTLVAPSAATIKNEVLSYSL